MRKIILIGLIVFAFFTFLGKNSSYAVNCPTCTSTNWNTLNSTSTLCTVMNPVGGSGTQAPTTTTGCATCNGAGTSGGCASWPSGDCAYCPPRTGYLFTSLTNGMCAYNKCETASGVTTCPAASREEVNPQHQTCSGLTPVCDFIKGCVGGTGAGADCEANGYTCLQTCGNRLSIVNSCRDRNLVCCGAEQAPPPDGGGTGTWGQPGSGPPLQSVSDLLGSGAPGNASKASFSTTADFITNLLIFVAIVLALLFLIWGGC